MCATYPSKRRHPEMWVRSILSIIVLCMVNSGCLVLRGERRYKPHAPRSVVKVDKNSDELRYSRLFDCPDFGLEIGIKGGPVLWDAPFWFYVLPIPVRYNDSPTQPFGVQVQLKPKSEQLTFDPWQTFFLGTNEVRVPPKSIWQDARWLGTNTLAAFPVTNSTAFYMEFRPLGSGAIRLSIEGVKLSGHAIPLPPIAFRPTTFIRPQFRLPY